jgi:hypothetical protein
MKSVFPTLRVMNFFSYTIAVSFVVGEIRLSYICVYEQHDYLLARTELCGEMEIAAENII